MKILFPIGTLYPSQQGGPSNTAYWKAKALVHKGVKVTFVTTDLGAEGKIETNRWLTTNYGEAIYFSRQNIQFPFKMIVTAMRLIRQHDCIHLSSLFYPPSFLLAPVAIFQKKMVVWSCLGTLHPQALQHGPWKKRPILWLIRNFLSGKHMRYHSTSNEESEQIKRIIGPNTQIVQLPNYMELPALQIRSKVSPPYFLYVGRLHPIKALDCLILALHQSEYFKRSGFILKIAGDENSPYSKSLKEQIVQIGLQKHVQFLGLLEGKEKQQAYADAHFTILPSHSENFGNVVIESLAQGTPVIASTGTPWAILSQQNAGFWVPNSPSSLAQTIDQTIHLSTEKYQDYRDSALLLVHQRFDIFANVEKWLTVYRFDF